MGGEPFSEGDIVGVDVGLEPGVAVSETEGSSSLGGDLRIGKRVNIGDASSEFGKEGVEAGL